MKLEISFDTSNTCFFACLLNWHVSEKDAAVFQRDLLQALRRHLDYPQVSIYVIVCMCELLVLDLVDD